MLAELGDIIDRLYGTLRRARSSKKLIRKKLIVIVGDGLQPVVNILNEQRVRTAAISRGYRIGTRAYENFRWRLFEYARYHTANALPPFAYCFIHRMIMDGICSDVISTNYDLYFDSIWPKYPRLRLAMNPTANTGEYLWDGYKCRRLGPKALARYWKIHGSLSHGVFRSKVNPNEFVLVALPRLAIPTNQADIAKAYGLDTTSPFLGYESTINPGTIFPPHDELEPTFFPFIDWTYSNDRRLFRNEIAGACAVLAQTRNIAGILVLGFRGYYNERDPADPRNEELVPVLQRMIRDGFDNVFYAVHTRQKARAPAKFFPLMNERFLSGKGTVFTDSGDFVRELISRNTKRFPNLAVESEYAKWANYFYDAPIERLHV